MTDSNVVIGAFASAAEADRAKSRLIEAGILESGIALSTDLGADALAGECPGQSYSNQPGQDSAEDFVAADTAHLGSCVLSVKLLLGADRKQVESILRECGAHHAPSEH